MALAEIIDAVIEPFNPRTVARRIAARVALQGMRKYDAADRGRRTKGWSSPSTSQDAESARQAALLSARAEDLVRNNKNAAAAVRQMVANMIGDGIQAQAEHPDPAIKQKAQDAMDRWAESRVDGFGDLYENQKLAARGMIVGGETLATWAPDAAGPDGMCTVIEGSLLDWTRNQVRDANGVRIVQGVETRNNIRTNYWLYDEHPFDLLTASSMVSRAWPAEHVDHIFERLRPGQTRGVSWLAPVAMAMRDIQDIEDAIRLKKKVEACLSIIITPPQDETGSSLTSETETQSGRPDIETLRPGMIMRTKPGEEVSTFNPSSTGDGTDFIRQQLAGISANLVPYHLMTGDVSQANYSSLRAALLGHWALLDDWQQNVMIPRFCRPAFDRRMRRLAAETGDRRFTEVRTSWALPVRRFVDPVKDLLGEVMEIRAGLKLLSKALAERGENVQHHLTAIAEMNQMIDTLGLALETDPRRLTESGVLQAAAGYIAPKGDLNSLLN